MGILDALGQFRATVDTKVRQPTLRARNNLLQELQLDALDSAQARQRKQLAGSTGQRGVLSQFGPETAQQLGNLIQSGDPNLQSLGSSLLGQLMQAKMAPKGIPLDERMLSPAQRVGVGDQRSQFQQQEGRQQEQWQAEHQLALNQDQRDQQRTLSMLAANQVQIEQAREQGLAAQAYGGLKREQYLGEIDTTRAIATGVGAARDMATLVEQLGNVGKIASPEGQAALQTLQFTLIPALQKSLNAGGQNALGTEEREFLQEFMGNPESFAMRPQVTIAKLKAISEKLEGDLDYRTKTRTWLPAEATTIPSFRSMGKLIPLDPLPRNDLYSKIGRKDVHLGWGIPQ